MATSFKNFKIAIIEEKHDFGSGEEEKIIFNAIAMDNLDYTKTQNEVVTSPKITIKVNNKIIGDKQDQI